MHPFSEFTASVAVSKIMNGERPGRPRDPDLTESVWDMTLGCWNHNPVDRPAMAKVVQILQEWLAVYPSLWNHHHDMSMPSVVIDYLVWALLGNIGLENGEGVWLLQFLSKHNPHVNIWIAV